MPSMPPKPPIALRKPSTVDPKLVESFVAAVPVAANPAVPSSSPSDVQASELPAVEPSNTLIVLPVEPPAVSPPEAPAAEPAKKSGGRRAKGRGIVDRKRGPAKRRMTIYIDPRTAKKLALYSLNEERDMSDVIEEAVELWLKRRQG